jgi:AcrR family transcriptional regulator
MTDGPDVGRAAATRARLAEAAVAAFADKGFQGTTTRDIATLAGLSSAALYVHHRSKEELLFLVSREGHERTLRLVRAAIAAEDSPAAALRRVVHDFALDHARDRVAARVVNYELRALTPEHLDEIRGIRRDIEEEIRSLVTRGVDAGVFEAHDPAMTAAMLLSLGIDLARWYEGRGRWTPEQVAAQYADAALRLVGAHASVAPLPHSG